MVFIELKDCRFSCFFWHFLNFYCNSPFNILNIIPPFFLNILVLSPILLPRLLCSLTRICVIWANNEMNFLQALNSLFPESLKYRFIDFILETLDGFWWLEKATGFGGLKYLKTFLTGAEDGHVDAKKLDKVKNMLDRVCPCFVFCIKGKRMTGFGYKGIAGWDGTRINCLRGSKIEELENDSALTDVKEEE